MDAPFGQVITSQQDLRTVYREPTKIVRAKVVHALDDLARQFISHSPFVLLATADRDGRCDVSPRGGPVGFVKVLDERRVVIPDLNGNNLLDSMQNIVHTGQAALLFLVPGRDETLRLNGPAVVSTEPGLLDLFTGELRRPTAVIGVEVADAYVHCAKSFRRGGVWDPTSWPSLDTVPTGAAMLTAHIGLSQSPEKTERHLEASYVEELAADRP